jgi:hypothetical protein
MGLPLTFIISFGHKVSGLSVRGEKLDTFTLWVFWPFRFGTEGKKRA